MPLSTNFRREMLRSIKDAKKSKDDQDTSNNTQKNNPDQNLDNNGSSKKDGNSKAVTKTASPGPANNTNTIIRNVYFAYYRLHCLEI
ncbi:unnamed protein product [Arctia plantaginis]|uniref:Uncharacterized protein n=1 Tax=Arctia plantaginis TaxID=874455 RepID=A0A8S0ZVT3_ARCPL|nr:unnamed protein product [Arctia plantaginis]